MSLSILHIVFFTSLTFVTGLIGLWLGRLSAPSAPLEAEDKSDRSHIFRFRGKELVWASEPAQAALSVEDFDEDVFHQLIARMSEIFDDLPERLMRATETELPIHLYKVVSTGAVELDITFEDDQMECAIRGLSAPLARHVLIDFDRAKALEAELSVLRNMVAGAPIAMWRETAAGEIDWVNRTYLNLSEDSVAGNGMQSWPPPRLFGAAPISSIESEPICRRSGVENILGKTDWFEVTSFAQDGSTQNYAVSANATVRAEKSLRDFMNSLTDTFAQLSVGLAVFDHTRRLAIFNPALPKLTGLRPEWLTARPTLLDFLDQMREQRALPERKNFADWRKSMAQMEQSIHSGGYHESWTLPTGQTYRVTGRPHPKGAIAFVLEDITAEISLTRRFRQELKLSNSVFDSFPEAIAVFGRNGAMISCNAAHRDLWGLAEEDMTTEQHISQVSQMWDAKTVPSPIWGEIRSFVGQTSERSEWQSGVAFVDGRQMMCRVVPVANGATLVGFSDGQSQKIETVLDTQPLPIAK